MSSGVTLLIRRVKAEFSASGDRRFGLAAVLSALGADRNQEGSYQDWACKQDEAVLT